MAQLRTEFLIILFCYFEYLRLTLNFNEIIQNQSLENSYGCKTRYLYKLILKFTITEKKQELFNGKSG